MPALRAVRTRRKPAAKPRPAPATPSMSAEDYLGTFPDEDAFQSWVVATARANGWRVFYVPNWLYRLAMASMKRRRIAREWADAGFPDVVLLRGAIGGDASDASGRVHVWELKTDKGRASKEQNGWISDFRAAGIDAKIVRPSDMSWIREQLK